MDSIALQSTMNTKILLILAYYVWPTFISCDEFCENRDGDLFWINNPVINYTVTDPEVSPIGTFKQNLLVDDHNYTLQIRAPPKGLGKDDFRIYYKEGFKSGDEVNIDEKLMLELIKKYGFRDLDLLRILGYQARTKKSPENPFASCYHYECDASVTNADCSLTANTPSCDHRTAIANNPSYWASNDGKNIYFFGQCAMKLTPVTGNIFDIWLGSAFRNGLPIITVLEDAVKLDWKTDATKFPEGTS